MSKEVVKSREKPSESVWKPQEPGAKEGPHLPGLYTAKEWIHDMWPASRSLDRTATYPSGSQRKRHPQMMQGHKVDADQARYITIHGQLVNKLHPRTVGRRQTGSMVENIHMKDLWGQMAARQRQT